MVGSDFEELSNFAIRWTANSEQPRYITSPNNANQPFTVTILDDDIPEPTEYFEVHFEVENTGFAFPSAIGRVTILDNDAVGMCDLYSLASI